MMRPPPPAEHGLGRPASVGEKLAHDLGVSEASERRKWEGAGTSLQLQRMHRSWRWRLIGAHHAHTIDAAQATRVAIVERARHAFDVVRRVDHVVVEDEEFAHVAEQRMRAPDALPRAAR